MNNKYIASLSKALCAGVFFFGLVSTANAALISRLGGLAYYDTVLDISWLADANAGAGSAFDDGSSATDGRMTWANANAWAASLNIGGIGGWRLPTLSPINGSNFDTDFSNNASTDRGTAPTTTDGTDGGWRDGAGNAVSEMGYMYYVNLANLGFCTPDNANPSACAEQTGFGQFNAGPFTNVQFNNYWSGVEFAPFPSEAWDFLFNGGFQDEFSKDFDFFAWAVHSGDVSAVPAPGTVALMGLGLAGLLGMVQRRRRCFGDSGASALLRGHRGEASSLRV